MDTCSKMGRFMERGTKPKMVKVYQRCSKKCLKQRPLKVCSYCGSEQTSSSRPKKGKGIEEVVLSIGVAVESMQGAMLSMRQRIERANTTVRGMAQGLESQTKIVKSLQQRLEVYNPDRRSGKEPEAQSGPPAVVDFSRAQSPTDRRPLSRARTTASAIASAAPQSVHDGTRSRSVVRRSQSNPEETSYLKSVSPSQTVDNPDPTIRNSLPPTPDQFSQRTTQWPTGDDHFSQSYRRPTARSVAASQLTQCKQFAYRASVPTVTDIQTQDNQYPSAVSTSAYQQPSNYPHPNQVLSSVDPLSSQNRRSNSSASTRWMPTPGGTSFGRRTCPSTCQLSDDSEIALNKRLCPPSCPLTESQVASINKRPCPPTCALTESHVTSVNRRLCPPSCPPTESQVASKNKRPCPPTCALTESHVASVNRRPCPPSCPPTESQVASINKRSCPPTCALTESHVASENRRPCPPSCPPTESQVASINKRPCPPKCAPTESHVASVNRRPCPPSCSLTESQVASINRRPCPLSCALTESHVASINKRPCPSSCPLTESHVASINRRPCPPSCAQTESHVASINKRPCPPSCPLTESHVASINQRPCPPSCAQTTSHVASVSKRPCPPTCPLTKFPRASSSQQEFGPPRLLPSASEVPIRFQPYSISPNNTLSALMYPLKQVISPSTNFIRPYNKIWQTYSAPSTPVRKRTCPQTCQTDITFDSLEIGHQRPSTSSSLSFIPEEYSPRNANSSSLPLVKEVRSETCNAVESPPIPIERPASCCKIKRQNAPIVCRCASSQDPCICTGNADSSSSEESESTQESSSSNESTEEGEIHSPDKPKRKNVKTLVEPSSLCGQVVTRKICCNRNVYDAISCSTPIVTPPPIIPNPPFCVPCCDVPPIHPPFCCRDHLSELCPKLGRELNATVQEGSIHGIQQLLDAGANVNYKSGTKWTALHRAAAKANAAIVTLLLKSGASVNAKTSFGYTALHIAAFNDFSGQCVDLLIDGGADVNLWNRGGKTALHLAAESGNAAAIKYLLKAGASKISKDTLGMSPADLAKTGCIRRLLRP